MSTLTRIEALEKEIKDLKANQNENVMVQMALHRVTELEQGVGALGRTVAALSEELVSQNVINSDSIMDRLRDSHDADNQKHVEDLKDSGLITEAEVVGENSLVIIRRSIVNTETGMVKVASNYQFAPMGNKTLNPVLRENLLNKTVESTMEGSLNDRMKEIITVMEVYDLVDKEVQGEDAASV